MDERWNEELKEGRKVSGSCAEILLTCTCWNLNWRKGMIYERRIKRMDERRKEGLKRRKE